MDGEGRKGFAEICGFSLFRSDRLQFCDSRDVEIHRVNSDTKALGLHANDIRTPGAPRRECIPAAAPPKF